MKVKNKGTNLVMHSNATETHAHPRHTTGISAEATLVRHAQRTHRERETCQAYENPHAALHRVKKELDKMSFSPARLKRYLVISQYFGHNIFGAFSTTAAAKTNLSGTTNGRLADSLTMQFPIVFLRAIFLKSFRHKGLLS